jgi:phosphonate transport system substrate-binding protein
VNTLSVCYFAFRGCLARIAGVAVAAAMSSSVVARAEAPYAFHVQNERSAAVTSQYWNPILSYVSQRSGVPLELRLARTAKERNALAEHGAYHFIYSTQFFAPEREKLGFRVVARAAGPATRGQIVVKSDSPVRNLHDLSGKQVAFGAPDAFAAYWLPMDALLRTGVNVKAVFTHDQDAGLAQLQAGSVAAMAVNASVVQRYAHRNGLDYRLLWRSELYNNLCLMASPKVPVAKLAAVRAALVNMSDDTEGRRILEAGARLLKSTDALGFLASSDSEYDNYRSFYKRTLVHTAN